MLVLFPSNMLSMFISQMLDENVPERKLKYEEMLVLMKANYWSFSGPAHRRQRGLPPHAGSSRQLRRRRLVPERLRPTWNRSSPSCNTTSARPWYRTSNGRWRCCTRRSGAGRASTGRSFRSRRSGSVRRPRFLRGRAPTVFCKWSIFWGFTERSD